MSEALNLLEDMGPVTIGRVIKKVYMLTGISMNEQKKTMLQSRMRRRMRELNIGSYDAYMDYLDKTPAETQNFINIMTTNETFFFRTPRVWEHFQKEFLPEWFKNNPNGVLKIWSAASSSGEEAYSIAISCNEFKLKNPSFDFKIMGSDISSDMLQEATAGTYAEKSIEFMRRSQPELFEKYFIKKEDKLFDVSGEIKKRVQFQPHNLFTVKKEMFDIIFLRNVLIYFTGEDQEKVLKNVAKSLKEEGTLMIGESESLNRLDTPYEFKSACVYKLPKKA
ncbi:protein-glutamate O-methyltransferase CheR [Bacteriovorax stolpii]|uniref:protein-glutamate O-methyltransferase n=1 Tax=Bacteriovorax stolpii TaxID=960 RepID=A0A2K9NUQ8_BACTC|nr:protein-glutamate O-methyltransferase CheR [Bacteriovorax stolpii]AUN99232.1 chemotaxis protein [Bacteriovorax stolpii]QDK40786.1 protein-glutamate O-methyltransferase CheR [Bacteriovorax stolpii]TDP55228.1 chemotaxis protein methyltransferase CheR [Bacteriovorax stolpii]